MLCCYDYVEIKSEDEPVVITDWKKFVKAVKKAGDVIRRTHEADGTVFVKLRSYEWGGGVLLSEADARKIVNVHKIPLFEDYLDKEGHTTSYFEAQSF